MIIKVYMKPNEKLNYHENLFEDYRSGLYKTYTNVFYIEHGSLDYRFYDNQKHMITAISQNMFYFIGEED